MISSYETLKLLILKRNTLELINIVETIDFDVEVDYINNTTSYFELKQDISTQDKSAVKGDIVIAKDELGKYIYYGIIEIYESENKKLYTSYIYNLFSENYLRSGNLVSNTRVMYVYNERLYNIIRENFIESELTDYSMYYPYLYNMDVKKILNNINLNLITDVNEKGSLININKDYDILLKNIMEDIVEAFVKAEVTILPKYDNTTGILSFDISNYNLHETEPIKIINNTVDIINLNIEYSEKDIKENVVVYINNGDFINNTIDVYTFYLLKDNTISTDENNINRILPPKTSLKVVDELTESEMKALALSEIGGSDKRELITFNLRIANQSYSNNFLKNNTNFKIVDFDYFRIGRNAKIIVNNIEIDTILKGYRIEKGSAYITFSFGKR